MVRMTAAGDRVSLSFQEDGSAVVDVLAFENESLLARQSEIQTKIDEQVEGAQSEP